MADEHMTAVYQLRKKDPSRDVVTFLVLNTPPGAIEGLRAKKDHFFSKKKISRSWMGQNIGRRMEQDTLATN